MSFWKELAKFTANEIIQVILRRKKKNSWIEDNKIFKNRLLEGAQQYSTDLNRSMLLISTGAISVSILFIQKNDSNKDLVESMYLLGSWGFFIACMILSCLEYLFIKKSIKEAIKGTDIILHKKKDTVDSAECYKDSQRYESYSEMSVIFSFVFLLCGMLCLVYFSYINLN